MKVAVMYFPGCDPDEIALTFQNKQIAVRWAKSHCEENGTKSFDLLWGKKFYPYYEYGGKWYLR